MICLTKLKKIVNSHRATLSWKFCSEQHAIPHRIYIAIIFYVFIVHPEVSWEWISQLLQVAGLFSYSCSPCLGPLFDIINLRPWYLQVITEYVYLLLCVFVAGPLVSIAEVIGLWWCVCLSLTQRFCLVWFSKFY